MKNIIAILGCLMLVFQVSANNMPVDAARQFTTATTSIVAMPASAPVEVAKSKQGFKERIMTKVLEKKIAKAQRTGKADDRKTHWGNIAGFATGIAALIDLFVFGTGLVLVFAICAIVFGAIGMKKSGEGKEYAGKGLGIAGFITGIVAAAMMFMALLVIASLF